MGLQLKNIIFYVLKNKKKVSFTLLLEKVVQTWKFGQGSGFYGNFLDNQYGIFAVFFLYSR